LAETELAFVAAKAGFEVKRVEVRGVNRMNELKIYEKVLGQREQRDAAARYWRAARRADPAAVGRGCARLAPAARYAGVVDVIERNPHAVLRRKWQAHADRRDRPSA